MSHTYCAYSDHHDTHNEIEHICFTAFHQSSVYKRIYARLLEHSVVLLIHILDTVLKKMIVHYVWNKQHHECKCKYQQRYIGRHDKCYTCCNRQYGKQYQHYEVDKSLMHEKSHLREMSLCLPCKVHIIPL